MNLNKLNDKDTSTTTKIEENNNCSSRSDAEDFVTASDCTGTPPSRSSSYHTPSEGEATSNSPWWELDTIVDAETTMDSSKCLQLTDESQQVSLQNIILTLLTGKMTREIKCVWSILRRFR